MFLRNGFIRAWESPTLASWISTAGRFLALAAVLPLILNSFSPEEVRFWLVITTLLVLNVICDAGMSPTFIRIYSYALAGAKTNELGNQDLASRREDREPNWTTAAAVNGACQRAFLLASLVYFLALAVVGSWFVSKPISELTNVQFGWIAWGIMLAMQPLGILQKKYSCYLLGTNLVALNHRVQALISLLAAAFMVVVVLLGGRVLSLVFVTQSSVLLTFLTTGIIARRAHQKHYQDSIVGVAQPAVWEAVWPRAWRSAIGHISLLGATQVSGLIYARSASVQDGAMYLLALRLVTTISNFSDAPFYCKLPHFGQLRCRGDLTALLASAKASMRISLAIYVLGVLSLGVLGSFLFNLVGSSVSFPTTSLWFVLAVAIFLQRYGSMNLQLYSTTNRIVWHWIAATTGAIFLLVSIFLLPISGQLAFPIGLVVGYGLIFVPWCSYLCQKSLGMRPFSMELRVGGPIFAGLLVGITAILLF